MTAKPNGGLGLRGFFAHRFGIVPANVYAVAAAGKRPFGGIRLGKNMVHDFLLLAVTDTIWTRLAVFGVTALFGVALIVSGYVSIKTGVAEESGKRRRVNRMMGESNTYTGPKAVMLGWVRLICGIGLILFGILFLFVGPFLAK